VGGYRAEDARTLEQLAEHFEVLPLAQAAAAAFPRRDLSADEANRLAHGGRLAPATPTAPAPVNDAPATAMLATAVPAKDVPAKDVPTAAFAPDGTLIALVTEESGQARPLVVFA
jgi:tRNA pseudouridine55 synthase